MTKNAHGRPATEAAATVRLGRSPADRSPHAPTLDLRPVRGGISRRARRRVGRRANPCFSTTAWLRAGEGLTRFLRPAAAQAAIAAHCSAQRVQASAQRAISAPSIFAHSAAHARHTSAQAPQVKRCASVPRSIAAALVAQMSAQVAISAMWAAAACSPPRSRHHVIVSRQTAWHSVQARMHSFISRLRCSALWWVMAGFLFSGDHRSSRAGVTARSMAAPSRTAHEAARYCSRIPSAPGEGR